MENQHQKITGYRDFDEETIVAINTCKDWETEIAEFWISLNATSEVSTDGRWMSIAKTHFQEGFSALVRAIAQPVDPFDRR